MNNMLCIDTAMQNVRTYGSYIIVFIYYYIYSNTIQISTILYQTFTWVFSYQLHRQLRCIVIHLDLKSFHSVLRAVDCVELYKIKPVSSPCSQIICTQLSMYYITYHSYSYVHAQHVARIIHGYTLPLQVMSNVWWLMACFCATTSTYIVTYLK